MIKEYKVSVAIATYNGAKYIKEQLYSIFSQTVLPNEIVICDDISTDDTVAIAVAELEIHNISYSICVNKSRKGFIKNFEKAMSRCSGDIICISDQDDYWVENKIETVLKEFSLNKKIHVIINNQKLVDAKLEWYGETEFDSIDRINSRHLYISGCCTSVRKCFLDFILPIDPLVQGHDLWIHEIASVLGVREVIREPLQLYRRHGMNESNSLASSVVKATFASRLKAIVDSNPEANWIEEVRRLNLYLNKLSSDKEIFELLGIDSNRVFLARNDIVNRIKNIETRLLISKNKRYKRMLMIFKLFRSGGYDDFSGVKTAVLDLIR